MKATEISQFVRLAVGNIEYKPIAQFACGTISVLTKDCRYSEERVNELLSIFWMERSRWWLWKKCVGFRLFCPATLQLFGVQYVSEVLDRTFVTAGGRKVFGTYELHLYNAAKDLLVKLPMSP